MRRMTITCDVCKENIDEKTTPYYISFIDPSVLLGTDLGIDLCEDCYNRIKTKIDNIIEEESKKINSKDNTLRIINND